ncbi:mechanosensitive ion channel family protein [Leptolyngbya sp. FACHB-17]|uniref:mechanosensitive ion channel family protein n=1 Tax=unclassified Leptolyngbya TaxID=2650499 RepID=UPI0016803589|nr:mechanosensitive ion channel family protein [Leptolyngbya sp. FACHB-17]MBD2082422.1 mechanosensitive ion channel family protein [Leptolyngbya sp. FACHB-17]
MLFVSAQAATAINENINQLFLQRNLINLALQVLPKLAWAIVILLFTRWTVNLIRPIGFRLLKYAEPTLQKFLIQVAGILVWMAGGVAALNAVGLQTTTIVAVIGAAGLAIGLALQNSLSHFAAGVMLVSFRPFEVGDAIEGAGVSGTVDNIGLFSTTIVAADNVRITVPNSNLFSGTLKNNTIMGTRRVDLHIDIGKRDIESTITHLLSLVQPHPLVLREPRPTCHVESITSESTILYLRPWCAANHHEQVKSEILQLAKEALDSTESSLY